MTDDYVKLSASDVGLRAPRSCTNIFGLILFFIFWGVMIFTAVSAYRMADLDRLLYGVDYMGNICGKGSPALTTAYTGPVADWSSRTNLWYPVTFDGNKFLLTEATQMGVCVASCPTVGQMVEVYYEDGGHAPNPYGLYMALFNSTNKFHRCVPDLKSFLCDTTQACKSLSNSTTEVIGDVYDGLMNGFESLRAKWWVLLACAGIATVISFLWMFILRRLVKPMVVITMAILVIVLAVGGYLLFRMHKDSSDSGEGNYYLGGAIAMWVVDFLILCVILFVHKDIMVSCDIIEEAAKIPITIPTMMLVPLVATLFIIPFGIFFLFTSASIYTAAQTANVTVPMPIFDNDNSHTFLGYNSTEVKQYSFEHWRIPAEIMNLLMFLWTVGFVNAIGYMCLAFCAIFWYWSAPGDDKKPEAGVCTGLALTFKNHLGTVALGSLIVAVIQVLRVLLAILEKHLERYAGKSDALKCCLYCAECLLACFNRVVKFINKNAYIMTAMTGEPFLTAAMHALSLLVRNAVSVAAISIIGEWVCLFGKVLITAITLVICFFMSGGTISDSNVILLMIVVGLVTYFITCVFINVFHVCIDTVLLSYCYDLQEHDGQGKPYYFPSDLGKHVERARERSVAKGQSEPMNRMDEPLAKKAA